jgi:tripartite-type tricarboxylate transporter receptor subunit TctC
MGVKPSFWLLRILVAASAAAAAFDHVGAAEFPIRNIRVVVPFAAAGVTDIVSRILFDRVTQSIGQAIVIDNRPGAGGNIGVDQVVKSAPDGYTLVVADPSSSLPANVTLFPNLGFHPVKDLVPIAGFGSTGAMVIVTSSLPVGSIAELVALAKSKPGELMFGSTGNGTPGHLNGERFSRHLGIKTVHVPYRVGSQGTTDLLTGRIHFWVAPIPTRLEQVNSGQLRALAIAGNDRSPDLPALPTIGECGFGEFDASTAYAVFAPRGTPAAVIDKLYLEIKGALDDEVIQRKLRAAGVEPKIRAGADVTKLLEYQIYHWAEVIKAAGISIQER